MELGRDGQALALGERADTRHPNSRAQGGRLPHGYRRTRSGMVEIDPAAAAEVRRIFELVRDGATIRAVAATMIAETGRPWARTVIERIVHREVYKLAEPGRIIDPRRWNATQTALAARGRRG